MHGKSETIIVWSKLNLEDSLHSFEKVKKDKDHVFRNLVFVSPWLVFFLFSPYITPWTLLVCLFVKTRWKNNIGIINGRNTYKTQHQENNAWRTRTRSQKLVGKMA